MRLFISYARLNRKSVEDLQDILQRAGHEAWFDEEITAGDDWWRTILTSIEACDIFVFALTPESTNSEACQAEFQYAITLNKPILPIMLKEAELPIGRLAETHYVVAADLRSADTVLEISRALFRLQERIGAGEFPAPEPKPERPPFPFPPDPLDEVREQFGNLRSLSEDELLGLVYRIKQVSRSSKRTSDESRTLLEKLASNHSLPYGIVQEARTALEDMPKAESSNVVRYAIGAVVIIVVFIIAYFVIQSMGGGTEDTDATETVFAIAQLTATAEAEMVIQQANDDAATMTAQAEAEMAIQQANNDATMTAIAQMTAQAETEMAIQQANDDATMTAIAQMTAQAETEMAIQQVNDDATMTAQANSGVISVFNASEIVQLGDPLQGHRSSIRTLDFSPDGSLLASGSSDFSFRVWDIEMQRVKYSNISAHDSWVNRVVFSPDGQYLATGDNNGYVYIWKTSDWIRVYSITPDSLGYYDRVPTVWDLAFSPDSSSLVIASNSGEIIFWSVEERAIGLSITETARSIVFSPDGSLLVSGNENGYVRIWNASSGELKQEFRVVGADFHTVAFSHDGTMIAAGTTDGGNAEDGSVHIWNVGSGTEIATHRTSEVRTVRFGYDDSYIASAHYDNTVRLWDTENQLTVLTGHAAQVYSLAINPDGTLIASGGRADDNTIRLWGLPDN